MALAAKGAIIIVVILGFPAVMEFFDYVAPGFVSLERLLNVFA